MAYIFVCSSLSPEAARQQMIKQRVASADDISVMPLGRRLKNVRLKRRFLFLLTYKDFTRNLHILNSEAYTATNVVVFAPASMMQHWTPVHYLDSDPCEEYPAFVRKTALFNARLIQQVTKIKSQPITRQRFSYLDSLVNVVSTGSVLHPLMTYIYTLPSATHQTPVKVLVCKYLAQSRFTMPAMMKEIARTAPISERSESKLRQILESPVAQKYRQMFASLNKTTSLEAACKKFGLAPYDARYILAILDKEPKNGTKSSA